MAKTVNTSAADAALDWVRARVTQMTVCTTQPTTYTQAITTYKLASVALTSTGMTNAAGDAGGSARKTTTTQKTGVSVATTGTAKFIALAGSTGSTLLVVTTCTSQALTTGNTITIPAWKWEIGDVT